MAPDVSAKRRAAEAERRGDFSGAIEHWRSIVRVDPGDGDAWARLAVLLGRSGAFAEAEAIYRKLLAAIPNHPVLLNNLGIVLRNAGRSREALAAWRDAARSDHRFVEPLVNAGVLLRAEGQVNAAIGTLQEAVTRAPSNAEAHFQLGHSFHVARRFEPAIDHLKRAVALVPQHDRARFRLAQCYMETADFAGFATMRPFVVEQTDKARRALPIAITPWFVLPMNISADDRRAVAAATGQRLFGETEALRQQMPARRGARARLHIGYIAADFRDHPIMHLSAGLFRRHDRTRFRVSAFAVYPTDDSDVAAQFRKDVDAFFDLSSQSVADAARRIYAEDVDILVDLSGFTAHARPEILAAHPAAIQVSWLGYPGTSSGAIYDYLVADQIIIPPDRTHEYLEKVVWMPHSYQINNNEQPIATGAPSRKDEGLPEGAFVFACFCQIGRIEEDRFALWMKILARVPSAVLWLLSDDALAIRNLRAAAQSHGIDPGRLVFARRRPKPDHLARLRLAGLTLDTAPYGAHTTASDALWAGVPFLTTPGESFASRVGASLLNAIGLPELIAISTEAYAETAVALATDPARLEGLKRKLAGNRQAAPLFDTARFVRALEAAYREMWDRREAGLPPGAMNVAPNLH